MSEGKTESCDWKVVVGVVMVAVLVGVALVAVGAVLWEMSRVSTKDAPTGVDAANAVSSLIAALGSIGTAWIAYVVFGIARELDSRRAKSSTLFVKQKLWRLLRNSDLLSQNINEVKQINRQASQQWRQELNRNALEMGELRERWGLEAIWDGVDHFNHLDEQTTSKMEVAIYEASTIEFALERLSQFRLLTNSTNPDYMMRLELTVGRLVGAITGILGVSPDVFSSDLRLAVARSIQFDASTDLDRQELLREWAMDYFPPMPTTN